MIEKLLNRNSVRKFTAQEIEASQINTLKEVINASPTTMNLQSFSAIFVTDPTTRDALMKLNWNQPHVGQAPLIIVFVADLNRLETAAHMHNVESTKEWDGYVTATIDATIASACAMSAAIDMGLGTCYIGGLRWNSEATNKLLNIEGDASVVLGLIVGYEDGKSVHRPKINKVYDAKYDLKVIKEELQQYDILMQNYYKTVFNKDTTFTKVSTESLGKIESSYTPNNKKSFK